MTRSEKAILQEKRRTEKEKKRRIELANKMLIPVGDKTTQSLGLISFDPSGVFRLGNNVWLKIFTVNPAEIIAKDTMTKLSGSLRITWFLSESGKVTCHLSLYEEGEVYEEVKEKFKADEETLKATVTEMNVDEVMGRIGANFYKDLRFSYASYVRGKKDWKKECFHEISAKRADFKMGRLFGVSLEAIGYDDSLEPVDIEALLNVGCPMYMTWHIKPLIGEDEIYFKRYMEKQYNRKLLGENDDVFINQSLSISFFADSFDAKEIVESTLMSYFLKKGILLVPAFGNQIKETESNLSYGLIRNDFYRNVAIDAAVNMIGGVSHESSKI